MEQIIAAAIAASITAVVTAPAVWKIATIKLRLGMQKKEPGI